VTVGAVILAGGVGTASPHKATTGRPDLVLTQATSSGSAAGTTTVTMSIRNGGTADARDVIFTSQEFGAGNIGFTRKATTQTTRCAGQPPPAGEARRGSCYVALIPVRTTFTMAWNFWGTTGGSFQDLVTVGSSNSDANFADNTSTLSSYLGPAADVRVTQSALRGAAGEPRKIRTVLSDLGPWTAKSVVLRLDIKAPAFSDLAVSEGTLGICHSVRPPSVGYDHTVLCEAAGIPSGSSWLITSTIAGTAGTSLEVRATVSASPSDPVPGNNTVTTTTAFPS
jgi:hypothetical protein